MGRKINLTEQQIKDICDFYIQGKSSIELAKMYNKTASSIGGLLRRRKVPIRSNKQNSRRYFHNENYFKVIDTEEKAYWLGFLYADGYITSKNNQESQRFGITLSSKDIDHLEKFKKCIQATNPIKTYQASESSYNLDTVYSRILITSQKTVDDLKDKGVVENKTNILKFPTEEQVPKELIPHFIRGYFDGDGCISICNREKRKTIEYSIKILGTESFLNGIKNFIELNTSIKIFKYYTRKIGQTVKSLEFSGNKQVKCFLDLLYKDATIYLDRKYDRYIKLCNLYK